MSTPHSDSGAFLSKDLHVQILELVSRYVKAVEGEKGPFQPGCDLVRYAGRVYDDREVVNLVSASLDFWLTDGPYAASLERALCRLLDVGFCRLVNSGSSANLVAFSALTSPRLGDARVQKMDEVITIAAGFPTTVAPVVQFGAVPVFVDVDLRTANIDVSQLEAALSPRTRAVMIAHTLGNPFDIDAVIAFCRRNDLYLIEDNCDALGSTYSSYLDGTPRTGTREALATCRQAASIHPTTSRLVRAALSIAHEKISTQSWQASETGAEIATASLVGTIRAVSVSNTTLASCRLVTTTNTHTHTSGTT